VFPKCDIGTWQAQERFAKLVVDPLSYFYVEVPPPPARPTISYPTFGAPKFKMPAPVEMIPHRRPATKILKELEEELERQRTQRPVPKGGASPAG